jgi:hypothetical protein
LLDAQSVERGRQRHRREEHGAAEVGGDQDRPPPHPVHPGAGEETDQQKGQRAQRGEDAHLRRRCVQDQHGGQRQCQRCDLRTEQRGSLCRPELKKVRMTPEAGETLGHEISWLKQAQRHSRFATV